MFRGQNIRVNLLFAADLGVIHETFISFYRQPGKLWLSLVVKKFRVQVKEPEPRMWRYAYDVVWRHECGDMLTNA